MAWSTGPSPVVVVASDALDRTPGILELAAGQMEQRHAGLPVVAELVRPLEGLGRPLQVAHPQPDLADLVVGEAEAVVQAEPLELLARLARLQLGLRPLPAEHLQLGAMDPADAGIAADSPDAASSVRPRRPTGRRA